MGAAPTARSGACRVVVVGPCGSGKTTLVSGLRARGIDAMVSGQEHSEIPTLWRHGSPDILIALTVDLATVRRRRGAEWPDAIFQAQLRRLADAMAAADVVLDAAQLDANGVLARAVDALRGIAGDCHAPDTDEAGDALRGSG